MPVPLCWCSLADACCTPTFSGDNEACTELLAVATNLCSATCTWLGCGDGVTDCGEACDDGADSPVLLLCEGV